MLYLDVEEVGKVPVTGLIEEDEEDNYLLVESEELKAKIEDLINKLEVTEIHLHEDPENPDEKWLHISFFNPMEDHMFDFTECHFLLDVLGSENKFEEMNENK